jgi:hypothetical protein
VRLADAHRRSTRALPFELPPPAAHAIRHRCTETGQANRWLRELLASVHRR